MGNRNGTSSTTNTTPGPVQRNTFQDLFDDDKEEEEEEFETPQAAAASKQPYRTGLGTPRTDPRPNEYIPQQHGSPHAVPDPAHTQISVTTTTTTTTAARSYLKFRKE